MHVEYLSRFLPEDESYLFPPVPMDKPYPRPF